MGLRGTKSEKTPALQNVDGKFIRRITQEQAEELVQQGKAVQIKEKVLRLLAHPGAKVASM